ncbi:MAG TPA: helix-turn-helix domain-containing protein [Actinomycetota bacterium]|nr:helix-turn-helix domain-containing protein [Actinomycetota bacterium]
MGNEEETRRKAVMRVLGGEPPSKVAADLGRTDRWVRKWVARYDPADDSWACDRSRAPATQGRQTPEEIERMVLEIRERLMADPWAQVGAVTIAWEMDKLGITPQETWTIERILRRAGVPKRRARNRYAPKGTPYPAGPLLIKPNAVHEIDLVGPRHLGRRRVGVEIIETKQEWEVAEGLVRLWRRLRASPRQVRQRADDPGQKPPARGARVDVSGPRGQSALYPFR